MEFIQVVNGLKITIDDTDRKFLKEVAEDNHNELCTDKAMYEFFEPYLSNSDYEWIEPERIGALTSAPILGITNQNDEVIEAFGFMDYQVLSVLLELEAHGEVFFQEG